MQVYHINCARPLESKLQAEATKLSPNQRPLAERPHKHQFPLIRAEGTAQRALLRGAHSFSQFCRVAGQSSCNFPPCALGRFWASRARVQRHMPAGRALDEHPQHLRPAPLSAPPQGGPASALPWGPGAPGHQGDPKARSLRGLVISKSCLGRRTPTPSPPRRPPLCHSSGLLFRMPKSPRRGLPSLVHSWEGQAGDSRTSLV